MNTLVSKSRVLLRFQNSWDKKPKLRMLAGIEAFHMIGWGISDWRRIDGSTNPFVTMKDFVDDNLLIDLVGNAFSGYHVMPIFAAAIACMGLFKDTEPHGSCAETQVKHVEQVAGAGSSDGSSEDDDTSHSSSD